MKPKDLWAPIRADRCEEEVAVQIERVRGVHISRGEIVGVSGMNIVVTDYGYCITSRDADDLAQSEARSQALCDEEGRTYTPLRDATPREPLVLTGWKLLFRLETPPPFDNFPTSLKIPLE